MEVQLGDDSTITIDNERYAPWPRFKAYRVHYLGGRLNCKHLNWLIKAEDLFCDVWQQHIPPAILRELRRYPEGHAELIELAQLDSEAFLRLSQSNPALVHLIAAYWTWFTWRQVPSKIERNLRRAELLRGKHRSVLKAIGLPDSSEWARILGKIPASSCYDFQLRYAVELCANDVIRRYLRHVSAITLEVAWLLRLEHPVLDMPLLELAAREPEHHGLRLTDIVSSIINKREMAVRKPHWPYAGAICRWEQLLRAEKRNAQRYGDLSELFPAPPVP